MEMDKNSKAIFCLLPADISGKNVLIVSNNVMEWSDLIKTCKRQVGTLTCCVTTENRPQSTEFQCLASKENLTNDEYKGRFYAVIFLNPVSDEAALDILKNTSLSLLSDNGYVACVQRCIEHATYDQMNVRSIEHCLKEAQQKGTKSCLRFISAKLINDTTQTFYCSVHGLSSLESRNFIGTDSFQEVLNNQVYTEDVTTMYESLYAKKNFISSGGNETAEAILHMLQLQPSSRILDVGSGMGGNSFLLAKKYDAEVYGTDICMNLVDRAKRTSLEMPELKVDFEVCDISLRNFPEASFDAIFSKDVILHIEDKVQLYKKFFAWLKPGGKLLVADFTRCEKDLSDAFKTYLEFRKNTWYLLTLKEYEQVVHDAGFVNVVAEDVSYLQNNAIASEYEKMKTNRQDLIKEYGEEYYNCWLSKLQSKYRDTQSGNHEWGLFYGEKAALN